MDWHRGVHYFLLSANPFSTFNFQLSTFNFQLSILLAPIVTDTPQQGLESRRVLAVERLARGVGVDSGK
ncbi:hypothetical protein C1631_023005 [Chryseobacterium phosphatilyticum]|uniref:Uncharacterized protein n=1 Tax=Chryseobacterium phosphatilyticum TaxID=475075 RepID=A0A316WKP4_9FLAO|nr:hypothetical protein C1631_023005 [Chryseobacterium phosphatilyticum]